MFFMRYSLVLTFQLKSLSQVTNPQGKQHLKEEFEKLEAFCDSFGGGISSSMLQGGNMVQKPTTPDRIYLRLPQLEQSFHFTPLDGKTVLLRNLKVYNMACSLPDCVLEHRWISKDRDLYFQITIKTSNEHYYKVLRDLYDYIYS